MRGGIGALARVAACACLLAAAGCSQQQQQTAEQSRSVGRGWPLPPVELKTVGAGGPFGNARDVIAARDGAVPPGVTPLERDIFTSPDFYADQPLWSDPRYYRCNSPAALEAIWGAFPIYLSVALIGDDPPRTAAWGFCDRDLPREQIVSPYPFRTAKEHYEALLEETKRHGGPTVHDAASLPKWDGRYWQTSTYELFVKTAGETIGTREGVDIKLEEGDFSEPPQWHNLYLNQFPTILSLLTPEYQKRFVQQAYHAAHDNSLLWPPTFCWPEGFMRLFHPAAYRGMDVMVMNGRVEFLATSSDNFIRFVNIGRALKEDADVPYLTSPLRRLYGETVGFWDKDVLITWTSNIQHGYAHGWPEHSDSLQTIEIYTPRYGANGRLVGLMHEAIFYDPEALVQPTRITSFMIRIAGLEEVNPYVYTRCFPTYFSVKGFPKAVSPGDTFEYELPDMSGRPWADGWEKYLEKNMKRPDQEQLFGF